MVDVQLARPRKVAENSEVPRRDAPDGWGASASGQGLGERAATDVVSPYAVV